MESSVQIVEISTLRYIPGLVAWGVGVVLAVLMVGRGGAKAEKLFLAGCSLMFVASLASPLLSGLVQNLMFEEGVSNIARAQAMGLFIALPTLVLYLAGLVCLVWAFWVRFRVKRKVSA